MLTYSVTTKSLISTINLINNNCPNGADQRCKQNQIVEKFVNAVAAIIEIVFRFDNNFHFG